MVAPPAAFSPQIASQAGRVGDGLASAIRGKPEAVRLSLVCLLARGHLLIEDVPGVGKTTLAQALARAVDCRFPPPAVHQRHAAQRRSGRHHLQRALRGLRVQARPHLQQLPAGRRDQPHHAQDAIGAARSHERRAGHHRRPLAPAAAALHGDRHAEPRGAPRHLSAARIAARPLPDAPAHRLSRRRQRARDPAQLRTRPRRSAVQRGADRRRHAPAAGRRASRDRGRRAGRLHARHRGEDAQPRIAGAGRQPARLAGAVPRRAGAGADGRPRLRHPGRRQAPGRARFSRTAW